MSHSLRSQLPFSLSYLFHACTPTTNWRGPCQRVNPVSSCKVNQARQFLDYTERICGCVWWGESKRGKVIVSGWNGGGSKKEEAWWPESIRKQLARCYTNFRTNLISCYQSCRTLYSAWLQICLWVFFSFCWILPLNCLYSFDWANHKMQICGTTDCFVY